MVASVAVGQPTRPARPSTSLAAGGGVRPHSTRIRSKRDHAARESPEEHNCVNETGTMAVASIAASTWHGERGHAHTHSNKAKQERNAKPTRRGGWLCRTQRCLPACTRCVGGVVVVRCHMTSHKGPTELTHRDTQPSIRPQVNNIRLQCVSACCFIKLDANTVTLHSAEQWGEFMNGKPAGRAYRP